MKAEVFTTFGDLTTPKDGNALVHSLARRIMTMFVAADWSPISLHVMARHGMT